MLELNFKPFPVLETNRLILRQITQADVNEMFVFRSDEKMMQYIDRPRAKNIQDAVEHIQKVTDSENANDGIAWGITLKPSDKMIGFIGFWRMEKENYRSEIGYMLHYDFHRKGIMQEAISKVVDFGFKELKFHSINANVNPANEASIKLLEKNNFVREALFREDYFFDGKFLDSAIYCILTPYP